MKKGFTLIELLGVIIILTILTLIVFPNIIAYIYRFNYTNNMEANKEIILSAAKLYVADNLSEVSVSNGFEYCVSLSKLVDDGYLKSPVKYSTVDDATGSYSVRVIYNKNYSYEVISNAYCLYDSMLVVQDQSNSPNASFLGTPILKNEIEEIRTVESYDEDDFDEPVTTFYDVSALKNGSITMWAVDEDDNGLYEVYIAQKEYVRANVNSRNLFSNMPNLERVNLSFNTLDDTDMSHMFENDTKLYNVDLYLRDGASDFSYMFNGCSELVWVDFYSSFLWNSRESRSGLLKNVSHMFYGTTKLSTVRMYYINFSSITNADDMFTGTKDTISISIPEVSESFIRNELANANITNYSLTLY